MTAGEAVGSLGLGLMVAPWVDKGSPSKDSPQARCSFFVWGVGCGFSCKAFISTMNFEFRSWVLSFPSRSELAPK